MMQAWRKVKRSFRAVNPLEKNKLPLSQGDKKRRKERVVPALATSLYKMEWGEEVPISLQRPPQSVQASRGVP